MTKMNVSELLMMTAEDIDFDTLDINVLEALIRAEEDQFIATNALHELGVKDSSKAFGVAIDVMGKNIGDKYLKAQALRIIYEQDKNWLLEGFEEKVSKYEQVLLDELIDLFWVDLKEIKKNKGLRAGLLVLGKEINVRGLNQFDNIEYVKDLLVACDK